MNSDNHEAILQQFKQDFARMQAAGEPVVAATSLLYSAPSASLGAEQVARLRVPSVQDGMLAANQHVSHVALELK